MANRQLAFAALWLVIALVVFIFADGARRWYSGVFFALLGVVMLVTALRRGRETGD